MIDLLRLPAGTCDSHCHIIGPSGRFPLVAAAAGAGHLCEEHPKEELRRVHDALGIALAVIVQSARHGKDNAAVQDAIACSEGRYLGVGIVGVDVTEVELARLASAGFRGVRFNFMRHLASSEPIEAVIELTPRLARFGLHLQVHFESDLVHTLGPHLLRSHVPVVIDHLGRVDASRGPQHADFEALCRLMADERFRVKVSGIDRVDRAYPYAHGVELARLLVSRFPDRCLWGTDWPHLNHHHQPDDAQLVELTRVIAPDPELHHRLLVANPESFYCFSAAVPSPAQNACAIHPLQNKETQ